MAKRTAGIQGINTLRDAHDTGAERRLDHKNRQSDSVLYLVKIGPRGYAETLAATLGGVAPLKAARFDARRDLCPGDQARAKKNRM